MALRKSSRVNEPTPEENSQEFKNNPEIDQKIDAFIRKNQKQFDYYKSLPKERLVRVLILKDIQARERGERARSTILRKLDSDPEMKKSVETLVRDLPEDRKRAAMANIASRTLRMKARRARQTPAEGGGSITPGL